MSLHEIKKGCKIIDEITLYLMKHGHLKLDIQIDKAETELVVVIKTNKCEQWLIDNISNNINLERELEVEEYGWELMGESDAQSELGLVGLLVDQVTVDDTDPSFTVFKLIRKERF